MILGITLGDPVVRKGVESTHEWSVRQTLAAVNKDLMANSWYLCCMATMGTW